MAYLNIQETVLQPCSLNFGDVILDCVILDCVILNCAILGCAILGCVILGCAILGCVILGCVILGCVILCCAILGCVIRMGRSHFIECSDVVEQGNWNWPIIDRGLMGILESDGLRQARRKACDAPQKDSICADCNESIQGCGSIRISRRIGPSELCTERTSDWNEELFARAPVDTKKRSRI
jgi:hypothetical protein